MFTCGRGMAECSRGAGVGLNTLGQQGEIIWGDGTVPYLGCVGAHFSIHICYLGLKKKKKALSQCSVRKVSLTEKE